MTMSQYWTGCVATNGTVDTVYDIGKPQSELFLPPVRYQNGNRTFSEDNDTDVFLIVVADE